MKKRFVFILVSFFVLFLMLTFVSAFSFQDFFQKISGKTVETTETATETNENALSVETLVKNNKCASYSSAFQDVIVKKDVLTFTDNIITASANINLLCNSDRKTFQDSLPSLLEKRSELLLETIIKDPEKALSVKELPSSITSKLSFNQREILIEKRGSFDGTLDVIHVDDFENKKSSFIHSIRKGTKIYTLHSSEELPVMTSGANIKVNGLALENEIAVAKKGFNVLSV